MDPILNTYMNESLIQAVSEPCASRFCTVLHFILHESYNPTRFQTHAVGKSCGKNTLNRMFFFQNTLNPLSRKQKPNPFLFHHHLARLRPGSRRSRKRMPRVDLIACWNVWGGIVCVASRACTCICPYVCMHGWMLNRCMHVYNRLVVYNRSVLLDHICVYVYMYIGI